MDVRENKRDLRSQLAEAKQQILDLREKLNISESTAFSLANQLQKYKCEECRDVLEAVLGERLDFWEEERAETPILEHKLREANMVIKQQAQELNQLRQLLKEGRDGSFLLKEHLKALLSLDNPDNCQGQGLREHLVEGRRLAEHLARTLSPENHEDEEDEKEQEPPAPRLIREVQEKEKMNGVPQDPLDDGHPSSPSNHDLCDTHQPACTSAILFAPQSDEKHEEGPEPMEPKGRVVSFLVSVPCGQCTEHLPLPETPVAASLSCSHRRAVYSSCFKAQQREGGDESHPADLLREQRLTLSSGHDFSDSCHPSNSTALLPDEGEACSSPNIAESQSENTCKDKDGTEPMPSSRELWEEDSVDKLGQDSLNACYLSPSSGQDFFDTYRALDSPAFVTDDIWAGWEAEKKLHDSKDEEGQEPAAPRTYHVLIQDQARQLTQLRQKLREGRDASSSLSRHLEALLTQEDSDRYQEELEEGRRLAVCLTRMISPENPAGEEREEEKEPLTKMRHQSSELDFLIEVQAREVTQLGHLLQKGREASSVLSGHLETLITHDHPEDSQGQCHQEHPVEGCRLAEDLAHWLSPENYEDEEDEEDLESLPSSVHSDLQEDAGSRGLSQALTEQDVLPGADLSDFQEPIRSTASLSEEPEVGSVLDGAAPMQQTCPQGPWSGDLSLYVSQMHDGKTQLQPSTLVTHCLQLQLDQQWGSGCGLARRSLHCVPWSLAASPDSGHQWLLFPGAQPRCPSLAQTVSPLLAGPSPLKPRMSERKLLSSKWRLTCSFPGLQLRVQR
ncbi:PREDICTED: neuroblastoma breakpoint family member 4-like [Propithecus coquereli]|uniref:neuroblastoma breakpoint family member 4-like n=1 Tax=Propithecus coquereli TaxID=379532 RepID=UPI00063F6C49|nr:PREDICTED: neuroblastoma breakpoint family member 4-like [Propithecus coquereli]